MTNEEKVDSVVSRAKEMLPGMKMTIGDSIENYVYFYRKSLLNMAEWKDKQFDNMINHFYQLIQDGIPFAKAYKQVTDKDW